MDLKTRHKPAQKGSALFMILVAVVLFAALSYTVAEMMRGGNPMIITEEKAKLYADELLNYSRALRQATQNVRINGCAELGISFETPALTGYAHTPALANACQIFHESGGAVNYLAPSPDWLDMSYTPVPALRGHWYFPANLCAANTGNAGANCHSDSVDNEALIAHLPYVRKEVCAAINNMVGVSNTGGSPPTLTFAGVATPPKFTGIQTDGSSVDMAGKMAGCFEGDGTSAPAETYHFYQVLLPR